MQKEENQHKLTTSQIEDLRLAARKIKGTARRGFQAQMCLKYCDGNARYAETLLNIFVTLGYIENQIIERTTRQNLIRTARDNGKKLVRFSR